MATVPLTSIEFRQALGHFATGVTVVTAERAPGRVHGMTATAFASVSLDPLLVLVCVAEQAVMRGVLLRERRFGINILNSNQRALSEFFAQPEQPENAERALGVRFRWTESGIPLIESTLVQLACNLVSSHIAGDHTVFFGEVESASVAAGEPLLHYRGQYRQIGPAR
ncbi:MAG TPA: flavin reductase family protein [Candidatus Acidoferrum sp.]|nr:flavin reductase family protein [Candidatus Acidoferrum sp.]